MATDRLYYDDSYLARFEGRITAVGDNPCRVYLDRSAFYPASGGQPADTGTLGPARVLDVIDEGDDVAHLLDAPLEPGAVVEGRIDWPRRFDHMQQHSGQHLLSALFADAYGLPTVSFHLGAEISTIDLASAALDPKLLREVERRANALVCENRPLRVGYEDASEAAELRKQVDREGTLRIVSIEGLDRSACGGTHVRSTGEIGPLLLRKTEKVRNDLRIEFLCGARATARARADFDALSAIGRAFSAPIDETPAMVRAQLERLQAAEKAHRKAATELARFEGSEAWRNTAPDSKGLRRLTRRTAKGAIDDELRAFAQGFCAGSKAVLIQAFDDPPTFLLAVSADSGIDAGAFTKSTVTAAGGRGGGNRQVAQGSLPTREALDQILTSVPSI